MGLYHKSGSPYWLYRFDYQGMRVHGSTKQTDKKLARLIFERKRAEYVQSDKLDQPERIRLHELFDKYMGFAKDHKRSWDSDESVIRIAKEFFADRWAMQLTARDLETYKAHVSERIHRGKRNSIATANRHLSILRKCFNLAIRWNYLRKNPVSGVEFYRERDRGRVRFLSQDEARRLLNVCQGALRKIVLFALYTGLRRGEVCGLRWDDVDLERNLITIGGAKSGKIRYVPLYPVARSVLALLSRLGSRVFTDGKGKAMHGYGWLRFSFDRAVQEAGLREVTFHTLRHTFASWAVMRGVDLKTLSELLGHHSVVMTEKYAHVAPSHKQVAINLLPRLEGVEAYLGQHGGDAPRSPGTAPDAERNRRSGFGTHEPRVKEVHYLPIESAHSSTDRASVFGFNPTPSGINPKSRPSSEGCGPHWTRLPWFPHTCVTYTLRCPEAIIPQMLLTA